MFTRKSLILLTTLFLSTVNLVYAGSLLDGIQCKPPVRIITGIQPDVVNYFAAPADIRNIYGLPSTGGTGTIAIIDAYDDPSIQNDFNTFSLQYGLPTATATNFEIHKMGTPIALATNGNWNVEEDLDVEWAHAIAPNAKILFIEATSANGNDLLAGVTYAASRSDVVAVSMSWGSPEFAGENTYDTSFISPYGANFFVSSGDDGTEVQWPAVSVNVTAVGGTSVTLTGGGSFVSETAWSGSGGGLSQYETEPSYQTTYGIPSSLGFRGVPDVSYNADGNNTAFIVFISLGYTPGYYGVGGTSAGTPQWAAIRALGGSKINNTYLYSQASSLSTYTTDFRDITTGTNSGTHGFYTKATVGYDYVTGLGSPLGKGLLPSVAVEDWMFYSTESHNTPLWFGQPKEIRKSE